MTHPRTTPYLAGLDTLRGLAALAVVMTHSAFWAGFYDAGMLGAVAQRLEVGVAVFFVLSGYLLSYPWFVAARTGEPRLSTTDYLLKRALRILPVYWVTVIAALTLVAVNKDADWQVWAQNLLMLQAYVDTPFPEGLTQMWSLITEVAFYIILPALLMALTYRWARRPKVQITALLTLTLASVVWSGLSAGPVAAWGGWVTLALPAFMGWFAAGMILAIIHVESRVGDSRWSPFLWCRTVASEPGACWMFAGALLIVQSTPLGGAAGLFVRTSSESVLRSVLYLAVAVAVMIPAVFGDPDTPYARTMASRPLRHLGRISYSLFCCHVIVLAMVFQYTNFDLFEENVFVVLITTLALSLVVSEVLYRLVERPFLRLKPRPTAPASTAPSASQTIS